MGPLTIGHILETRQSPFIIKWNPKRAQNTPQQPRYLYQPTLFYQDK